MRNSDVMDEWVIETTENFDEKGFYIILENQVDYKIIDSGFFLKKKYPHCDLLQNMDVDLEGIEFIYEIKVEVDQDGQRILVEPKGKHQTISKNNCVKNTLFVINLNGSLWAAESSKSKGKVINREKPTFPF